MQTLPFLAPDGWDYFCDLKNLIIWLYFSENIALYNQTKMTELKHTTTVQRNITSENRHKVAPWFVKASKTGVTNLYVTESYFLGTD